MSKKLIQVGLSAVVVAGLFVVGGSGIANADSAGQSSNTDWRGDRVSIHAAGDEVSAEASDVYPGATVYLSIIRDGDGATVAGPVVARSIRANLPAGRYHANYYVATTDLGDAQIDSPAVTT